MNIDGKHYRTIWLHPEEPDTVQIIDQRWLPHQFIIANIKTLEEGIAAIADMLVRGAPLIGATAAWTLYLVACQAPDGEKGDQRLREAAHALIAARPTAINLRWAVARMGTALAGLHDRQARASRAREEAERICDEDADTNRQLGEHGVRLLRDLHQQHARPINILTHCNAGWLATVDWGTISAPIYLAHAAGIDVHVWVDETRPRNQGAHLTAWELAGAGIPHTLIVDNAGGHLMQQGLVDICIIGTDRTTRNGDVCNKIGTYLKALAAYDNQVPFYIALPSSTIDWELADGMQIPIEQRDPTEVTQVQGWLSDTAHAEGGTLAEVRITPAQTEAANPAFDVTPARLVTGLITERGVCAASPEGLAGLFPERAQAASR